MDVTEFFQITNQNQNQFHILGAVKPTINIIRVLFSLKSIIRVS